MTVRVNDEPVDVPEAITVAALLVRLGYQEAVVAVAVDGAFVARGVHATTVLAAGSRVEIVAPMAGG